MRERPMPGHPSTLKVIVILVQTRNHGKSFQLARQDTQDENSLEELNFYGLNLMIEQLKL